MHYLSFTALFFLWTFMQIVELHDNFCSFLYYAFLSVESDEPEDCTDHSFCSKGAKGSFQMCESQEERTLKLPMRKEG